MVNLSEKLAPIYRDETEERIKNQKADNHGLYKYAFIQREKISAK